MRSVAWRGSGSSSGLRSCWPGALVIVGFGVAIPNGTYLTWTNFSVLFTSQAPAALLALALIVPLTAGDYDLSVGANVTLAAMMIGVLNAQAGWPLVVVLPLTLASGAAVGLVNAFFIVLRPAFRRSW